MPAGDRPDLYPAVSTNAAASPAVIAISPISPILSRMNDHSPIVSEFDSPEQAASYERWLRAKVAASLANPNPPIPHDEVMAEIRRIIEAEAGDRKA